MVASTTACIRRGNLFATFVRDELVYRRWLGASGLLRYRGFAIRATRHNNRSLHELLEMLAAFGRS